jgi:hypothetical protein
MGTLASASVTLNAAGYGTVFVACPSGAVWHIEGWSVSTSQPNPIGTVQPVCTVYADSTPNITKYVESTSSGNRDTSNTRIDLGGGEFLCAEWAGGLAGVMATFTVRGRLEIKRGM